MILDFLNESGKIMLPLTLKLKTKELIAIKEFLNYEEPRVIRRANILNCLHHGYSSSEISMRLNVYPLNL